MIHRFILLLGAIAPMLSAQTANPVPEKIRSEGRSVEVVDWIQAPATAVSPRARLAVMKPAYDGSGRIFVNDLRGRLYVIDSPTATEMTLYLNLKAIRPDFVDSPGLGTGFTGFAFDPEFAVNGRLFTSHMEAAGSGPADFGPAAAGSPVLQGVILEWTAINPEADSFGGSHRELMRIDYTGTIHGLQDIAFNPYAKQGDEDYGLLYICAGDGGAVAAKRPDWAHSLSSVYGSLLRIDPDGINSTNGRYGVPVSNPFVDDGDPASLGEIYAWGFRNPHRISWDPSPPHRLFLGDIGENLLEEVNLVTSGGDYGYSAREGTFVLKTDQTGLAFPLPPDDALNGFVYPVAQYDHDEGAAIAGGFVYRGEAVPSLSGLYLFGDIRNGRVFYVDAEQVSPGQVSPVKELLLERNGVPVTLLGLTGSARADLRFGVDAGGELYLMTKGDGKIRRLASSREIPPPDAGRMVNISTRGFVGGGAEILIAGFVIEEGRRQVLIRGVGPSLVDLGVTGFLDDPVIFLRAGEDEFDFLTNDDWESATNAVGVVRAAAQVGAFPLRTGSRDAALLVELDPGLYTVRVRGKSEVNGIALVEVYEVRWPGTFSPP